MPKEFKTIEEQLEMLKKRGLSVPCAMENEAKEFLKKNNYYRVSGYSLTLRNRDSFHSGTSFRNIMDIYNCDRELRNVLLWAIEIIEVNIKSRYAYLFSKIFGALGYMDSSHFTNYEKYTSIIHKANNSIKNRLDQEAYLQHYVNVLKEPIPLWAYVDVLTISDISMLYSISDDNIKQEIAREYGLTHNKASTVLTNYLHGITIIRNLCAHNNRLFNRLFITKPDLNKKEQALLNKDKNGNPDNSKLFGYILIIRRMLTSEEFAEFKRKIQIICDRYSFVDMRYYGFCPNWDALI